MSEAKSGVFANVWEEGAVGLFVVALDVVNAFGFVPLHVLKPMMRINVSISMPFGIAASYSRECAMAMRSGVSCGSLLRMQTPFCRKSWPHNLAVLLDSCIAWRDFVRQPGRLPYNCLHAHVWRIQVG
jgi:hypothetical protein